MFRAPGRQTGTSAGRHPEDQQGEEAATVQHGADHGSHRLSVGRRRRDRHVQIDVGTVGGRERLHRADNGRPRLVAGQPRGRRQPDGHRAGGQAQTVHVGHGSVQPGVLRAAAAAGRHARLAEPSCVGRRSGQQPGVPTVPVHDARQGVQPAPTVFFGRHRRSDHSTVTTQRPILWPP